MQTSVSAVPTSATNLANSVNNITTLGTRVIAISVNIYKY